MAMMSSRRSGLSRRSASRMPADSSWKTPKVLRLGEELVRARIVEGELVGVEDDRRATP